MTCLDCRFAVLKQEAAEAVDGDGNPYVTVFMCAREQHPGDPFELQTTTDDRLLFGLGCRAFHEGPTIVIDEAGTIGHLTDEQRSIWETFTR